MIGYNRCRLIDEEKMMEYIEWNREQRRQLADLIDDMIGSGVEVKDVVERLNVGVGYRAWFTFDNVAGGLGRGTIEFDGGFDNRGIWCDMRVFDITGSGFFNDVNLIKITKE